ncbi:MAG: baseplate J/gp47 family protein [Tagaea sp.]|nr:baseplate J/gp47 family protein [Tagaea sp.]
MLRPSLSALVARAEADLAAALPESEGRLRHGVLPALIRAHAGAAFGLYGYIDDAKLDLLPDTARGAWLVRAGSLWGVARKPESSASGTVTATGTNGAVIPAATALVRADGAIYRTLAEAIVAGGTAALSVNADIAGTSGNATAATKLRFLSPIAGIAGEAIVAAPGLAGGADPEAEDAWRARILARIQNPPQGGAQADYVTWAREVPGVTRAWVYPGELGLGTVTVRFATDGEAGPIPAPAKVIEVASYIAERRPVTAQVTVVAPIALPIAFQIAVVPSTAEVKAKVEAELRDLIARDAVPGGTILLSRMREAISVAAGETDNTLVAPSASVVASIGQLATFGGIVWS